MCFCVGFVFVVFVACVCVGVELMFVHSLRVCVAVVMCVLCWFVVVCPVDLFLHWFVVVELFVVLLCFVVIVGKLCFVCLRVWCMC